MSGLAPRRRLVTATPRDEFMRNATRLLLGFCLLLGAAPYEMPAQKPPAKPADDKSPFGALKYRLVGPFRGGRSAACCGVPGKPMQFYFGATGGGVWKTTDGGATWDSVSDGFFGGS